MPVIATPQGTLASDVTRRTRSLLNDMLNGNSEGDIFADSEPYVIEFLNSAIDYVTNKLTDAGVETNTKETYLYNVPVSAFPADPNAQIYIDYNGTNDGRMNYPTPSLPSDMEMPLKIWSRQTGTNNAFVPVGWAPDGLGVRGLQVYQRVNADWDQNTLYLNACAIPLDLRIRYICPTPSVASLQEYIPIGNAKEALANCCAAKFELSRGNPLAGGFLNECDKAIDTIVNRTQRRKDRVQYRRKWRG